MTKYALILVAAIALAPTSALAATSGTVRIDLFDDVSASNVEANGDFYTMGGEGISGSTGFFLFDISNNAILDAELNILTGGSTVARTFDETDFAFTNNANGIDFSLANAPLADLAFDETSVSSGQFSRGGGSIDFANESGLYQIRMIAGPGFSPSFHFFEDNPGLIFTPAVPEPSSALLLGLASMGAFGTRRR